MHFERTKPVLKYLGSIPLHELSTAHLIEYQTQRKAQGVSNRTVNMEIGLIRKALNWAIDMGIIEGHKVKKFPMLPESKRLHAYLTEEEVNRLFEVLKRQNPLLAYRMLFNVLTGLRPKEIAFLEWSDIDLANRVLFVRSKPENQIKDREERAIPLCDSALRILEEVKRINPNGRYVFSRNGKPVLNVKKQLERACKKAGLEKKVFPYMLRHTFAVMCLKAGINIYDLKTLMGHSDIETTARYLHTCNMWVKEAVRKLDNLLFSRL